MDGKMKEEKLLLKHDKKILAIWNKSASLWETDDHSSEGPALTWNSQSLYFDFTVSWDWPERKQNWLPNLPGTS